jgi:hypothetical protein
LRLAHTLVDALLATAIMVVWQRLYGAQETGWMAAPLRLMGFVPAVVHMAWTQVFLAQPHYENTKPFFVGSAGFVIVALLGAVCATVIEMGWLEDQWKGLVNYLLPLVVWQGSACLVAAFSHLPFHNLNSRRYSLVCMRAAAVQGIVLLTPLMAANKMSATSHIIIFSLVSAICQVYLTFFCVKDNYFEK